ncbi:MAG: YggS family pyridoxal phosphate-dependent enzyme [Desulfobulbus sp.]|jgi:pyridoxal phosphate enzyme (YggS family)
MTIKENLASICSTIQAAAQRANRDPALIRLVAVSKQMPTEAVGEAMQCGQPLFGENYLQEAAEKIAAVPHGARWHFIGHLQSNKARQAAELFDMVETVDRLKIARALDRHAQQIGKTLPILVQVNVGRDPRKAGVLPEDAPELLRTIAKETRLPVHGLMTMPPFTDDPEQSRPYFKALKELAKQLADKGLFADNNHVELSMGMSADYPVAIEEGATLVRVGTALFGTRSTKGAPVL